MNSIEKRLTDKRILIFGYGREGKSTEEYIKKHVRYKSLDVFEGKREDIDEDSYDVIIKSPGIVMLENNEKYTSQTELFLDEFSKRTIGITGTKGKSTTSAMLAHVLVSCGVDAILLGNIGKPCFDMIDEIKDDTWIVFELSCHQLLHIRKAPHVAVFLNLFEEHLDYYGTLDKYFGAKANIISHQEKDDVCFVGSNVPEIACESLKTVLDGPGRDYSLSILGEHNKTNAEFVYRAAQYVLTECVNKSDVSGGPAYDEKIISAIAEFKGLPHRLEYFAEKNGVKYYDDSISTIPEACINAVRSVENAGTVIVGGMDRGIDYDILVDFMMNTPDVLFILCYKTGERIAAEIEKRIYGESTETSASDGPDGLYANADIIGRVSNAKSTTDSEINKDNNARQIRKNVMLTEGLDGALTLAVNNTPSGRACILSPAAPSYGYFKNFEERGEYFKSLVAGTADTGNSQDTVTDNNTEDKETPGEGVSIAQIEYDGDRNKSSEPEINIPDTCPFCGNTLYALDDNSDVTCDVCGAEFYNGSGSVIDGSVYDYTDNPDGDSEASENRDNKIKRHDTTEREKKNAKRRVRTRRIDLVLILVMFLIVIYYYLV